MIGIELPIKENDYHSCLKVVLVNFKAHVII